MKKRDSEVISTTSSTSKGSERRKNRFSISRIFYNGRPGRTKSRVSLNSTSSAQSEYSFVVQERERDKEVDTSPPATATLRIPQTLALVPPATAPPAKGESDDVKECPLCMTDYPLDFFPEISTCYHRSCLQCLQIYLRIEITESRINIACPECAEKFHPNDIKRIVEDQALMLKYEDFMVRRVLVADPDARWCPAPDCGYAVIAYECAGCPKIKCERPGCDTYFCYHCKQYWHPNKTCDAARAERLLDARTGSVAYSDLQSDNIKPCPRCAAFIMKMNDGSCNHMTCPVCGAEFCWLCMKEISDLHYLSPSGCTFWGKKPWSRKKKILWQLGTLVGAPVGITLMAGIAVPAMIIGIPVWVGKKIHSKYEMKSRHKRNLAITGAVAASVLMAPIVAGLAVGIGVPILLGYVYGVVPISLCRSGGCGVTTTNSGGVRFEFEENETGAPAGSYHGDSQSVGTGQVPNPSIAPSIGEASMGMTNSIYSASSTHMDRVGIIRDNESDRDSASNRAIAGASLNGSMCGSTYAAVIGLQTKLEVQAELVSGGQRGKRASFSSESANFSIGDKYSGEKDTASTKGLAGSIANYKLDTASITTSDVQVDVISNHSKSRRSSGESGEPEGATSLAPYDKKKTHSCPGSPLSGCSSICDNDDHTKMHILKCRKCRRLAKSAEKHAPEHMNVHFCDQVSLQSFQAEDAVLDLPMGKLDVDTLSEKGSVDSDGHIDNGNLDGFRKRSPVGCMNPDEPAILLTEVESDKPIFLEGIEKLHDKSPELGVKSNDNGFSVNSTDNTQKTFGNTKFEKMSRSIKCSESCSAIHAHNVDNKSKTKKNNSIGRVRHRSCELALDSGRISPLTMKESNSQ